MISYSISAAIGGFPTHFVCGWRNSFEPSRAFDSLITQRGAHMSRTGIAALASLVVGLALAGCPRVEDPVAETAKGVPGPVAAPPEPEPVAAAEPAPAAAPEIPRRAVVTGVSVVRIEAERGEDGKGATVEAAAPVAIDISAEAWPVRALDPVLHVGDLVFRHYTFPRVNVLRFVVADSALLPDGAAAWVQYGDDLSSRTEVADRLEVPR
jgi:hypothetical protein